jgi:ABC-2 type transport system ATP-binding protein
MEDSCMSTAALEGPALILESIGKIIGTRVILADISMSIHRGQIHGLMGPNGSGKTTLLRILAGFLRFDSGRIERHHGSLERIGYVSQRFCLYDELTVRENLWFQAGMRGVATASVAAAERTFELSELGGRPASALSGGQRQRLLIAAAFLHRPTLVLCDEPTTALDSAARRGLWELLRRQANTGTTIVLTTHEEADASECDVITRLQDGRIAPPQRRAAITARSSS